MPEEKEVSITTSPGNVTYPPTDGTAKLPPYYCNHNTSDDTDDDSQTDTEKVENIRPVLARIKAFDNKSVYTVSTQIQSANLVTCINPVKEKLTDVDINDLIEQPKYIAYSYFYDMTIKGELIFDTMKKFYLNRKDIYDFMEKSFNFVQQNEPELREKIAEAEK